MAMSGVIVGSWDGVDAASYGIQMYWAASTPYTTSEGTFTNISWDLQVYCGFASSEAGSWSEDTQCYINIDGNRQLVFNGTFSFRDPTYRNWTTVFSSGSSPTPVKYNSDGTKSVYLGFEFLLNTIATKPRTGSGDGYVSDTVTLDPVPVLVDITYHSNYTPGVADHVQSVTKNVSTPVWNGSGWTRTGYQLTGWNTYNDGSGTPYSTSSSITTSANMDLYAIWSPEVTFNANTGSGTMSSVYVNYYNGVALPQFGFTKVNYNPSSSPWNTNADGSGTRYSNREVVRVDSASKAIASPTTLYAIWSPNISYRPNGGSGGSQFDRICDFYNGDNIIDITDSPFIPPTGKRFNGWNTQADGSGISYIVGSHVSYVEGGTQSPSVITGFTRLYAQWADNSVTITYKSNYSGGPADNPISVTPGVATTVWSGSTWNRTGYKLIGWNTADDGSGTPYPTGSSITVSADTNLYAVWYELFEWTSDDSTNIVAGKPTTNALASKFNELQNKVHYYINNSYIVNNVSSGNKMTATAFNGVRAYLTSVSSVTAGNPISAQNSFIAIKNALNNNAHYII